MTLKEGAAMLERKQNRYEQHRHEHEWAPVPLYLPLSEPMPLNPANRRNDEEKTERGVWIIDI
jgi:hypothetical protein